MQISDYPFVSIVTPVYNGARFLPGCIESVMRQTYPRLEHLIVDNASADSSLSVAKGYANRDRRIRVVECTENLPVVGNWNRALTYISGESRYVWVLPADDAIMGDSLARMVRVAWEHPSVGIVASQRLRGNRIECLGLDPRREVFSGREIVQSFMREEVFAFSPTGSLIRRDLIDARDPFYPHRYLHADIAAFFDVLDGVDFGFVHNILMFSREHEQSVTSTVANRYGTQFRDGLLMLKEFGPRYLEPEDLSRIEARFLYRYYRFLVRSAVLFRDRNFFAYHAKALRGADCYPGIGAIIWATVGEIERALLRPLRALSYIRARFQYHKREGYFRDGPSAT